MTCTCRTTCKVRQTRTGLTFRAVLCSRFTAGVRGTSSGHPNNTHLVWCERRCERLERRARA
jgi:hypothetical protein